MITLYVKNPTNLNKAERQARKFLFEHNGKDNVEVCPQTAVSKELLVQLLQEYGSYAKILTRQGHETHADKTFSQILTCVQNDTIRLKLPIIVNGNKVANGVKDLRRFVTRQQRLLQASELCATAVELCGLAEEDEDVFE